MAASFRVLSLNNTASQAVQMINKLVKGQCFAAEAAGGAGEDEASSTDSES